MFKIIIKIVNHPLNKGSRILALLRFIKWQIISRIYSYPILLPFTDNSNYLCWNGLTGLTGNWYCGLMEMEEMSFAYHLLRKEDVFFDIGANVGAYSILVSQQVNCEVFSFEPHPKTFEYLTRNIQIQNKPNLVTCFNFGLGEINGKVNFTENLDTVNHVVYDSLEKAINIDIKILDELSLPIPVLIKLDVEGFEFQVLNGSKKILNNPNLKAIIIELNNSGLNYGVTDTQIHEYLSSFDFQPYTYDPFRRRLIKLESFLTHNTIYLRDFNFCNSRVKSAFEIHLSNGKSL